MNEHLSSWIEYLHNKVALKNTFGANVPALDNLMLARLVIDQPGGVYISLNFPSLPPGSPTRWSTRGCDGVQLRLSFHDLAQLSITGAYDGNLEVTASFGPERCFSISNPEFEIALIYGYATADMYPYDSRVFEEPARWYHTWPRPTSVQRRSSSLACRLLSAQSELLARTQREDIMAKDYAGIGQFIYGAYRHGGTGDDLENWMADDVGMARPEPGSGEATGDLYATFFAKYVDIDELQANYARFISSLNSPAP